MSKNKNHPAPSSNFFLYIASDGTVKVEVFIQDETVWLNQKTMGQLFGVESHTITYHLKEIFKTGELDEEATTRKIRAVQNEGKRQSKNYISDFDKEIKRISGNKDDDE
jgi:hypothetical protein